jgi:acyl-CoA thioesterase FadM
MRSTFVVTRDDCRHPDDAVDPDTLGYGEHLPFHTLLQRCGLAWRAFLASLPGVAAGGIVPSVRADFRSEVQVGNLEVETSLVRLGTMSLTIRCDVTQAGRDVATVKVVVVNFDYERRVPTPLSPGQRRVLGMELTA